MGKDKSRPSYEGSRACMYIARAIGGGGFDRLVPFRFCRLTLTYSGEALVMLESPSALSKLCLHCTKKKSAHS